MVSLENVKVSIKQINRNLKDIKMDVLKTENREKIMNFLSNLNVQINHTVRRSKKLNIELGNLQDIKDE